MNKILISLLALLISTNAYAGLPEVARLRANGMSLGLASEVDDIYYSSSEALAPSTLTVSGNATVGGTLGVTGVSTFTASGRFNANPGIILGNAVPFISVNTTAGSDTKDLYIAPNASASIADGALVRLKGNEASLGGSLILSTGDASTADMFLASKDDFVFETEAGADLWVVDARITQDSTNGLGLYLPRAGTVQDAGILLGIATRPSDLAQAALLVVSDVNTNIQASFTQSTNDVNGNLLYVNKSRATNGTADTIVANGDSLGTLLFQGADGASYRPAVRIVATVDGAPGSADMPGALDFQTSPDGSATTVSVLKLSSDKSALFTGTVRSSADNAGWFITTVSANTACTSRCTSAALFGFGLTGDATFPPTSWVDPTDAAADICACMGAS